MTGRLKNPTSADPLRTFPRVVNAGSAAGLPDSSKGAPAADALSKLKSCENNFRHADARVREFIQQNAGAVNGPMSISAAASTCGEKLHEQFSRLCRARDAARAALQDALRAWAEAKIGRSYEMGVEQ
jgi:hypothetical protein